MRLNMQVMVYSYFKKKSHKFEPQIVLTILTKLICKF